MKKYMNKLFCA